MATRIEDLFQEFDQIADSSKSRIQTLLSVITEGKVPSKSAVDDLEISIFSLQDKYDSIYAVAKEVLGPDEMPEKGSPAKRYVEAVASSKAIALKKCHEKALWILQEFIKVRAFVEAYEKALVPFQQRSSELMSSIQSISEIRDIEQLTLPQEMFMSALKCADLDSEEGLGLLEKLDDYYPRRISNGIARGQYYLPDIEEEGEDEAEQEKKANFVEQHPKGTTKIEEPQQKEIEKEKQPEVISEGTPSTVKVQPSNTMIVEENIYGETTGEGKNLISVSLEEQLDYIDDARESKKQEAASESDVKEVVTEKGINSIGLYEVSDSETLDGYGENILIARNKIKQQSPSANAFKKEIKRMRKGIGPILALFTNLGAMTIDQIHLFGVIMDHYEESTEAHKEVCELMDLLASKSLVAEYPLSENEKVYCLTSYTYGCMKKSTISSMTQIWGISLGNHKFCGEEEVNKDLIMKVVSQNEHLLTYVRGIRAFVSKEDFYRIRRSIKREGDHYKVGIFRDGKFIICTLIFKEELGTLTAEGPLLLVERPDESLVEMDRKVFLFEDSVVTELLLSPHEHEDLEKEKEEVFDRLEKTIDVSNSVGKESVEEEVMAGTGEQDATLADDVMVEGAAKNDTGHNDIILGYIDRKNAPSDEELFFLIDQILNDDPYRYSDDSSVVQATLLAKAAACSSQHIQCNKIYKQLLLATDLPLDDHAYTAEALTNAFYDPNEALLLSAYMYALLVPGIAYDFGLQSQADAYLHGYEQNFPSYPSVKALFSKLVGVRKIIPIGFTNAVITLLGDVAEKDRYTKQLQRQAKDLLILPNVGLKKFYSKVFGVNSEFYECMKIIEQNDTENSEIVQLLLEEYAEKQQDVYQIRHDKIEEDIEKNRIEYSNQGDPLVFESGKLNQLSRHYYNRLELMKAWLEHVNIADAKGIHIDQVKQLKSEIITLTDRALKGLSRDAEYQCVVRWMLKHIKNRLTLPAQKYHTEFSEFLCSGVIPLDAECVPIINPNMDRVQYYEPWRNVLRHMASPIRTYDDAAEAILDDTSLMFDNLHQRELIGEMFYNGSEEYLITDASRQEAIKTAELNTTKFQETLELAYTYNRINEIEKENLAAIMSQFKGSFFARGDYGIWKQFLKALEKRIDELAAARKAELRKELDARRSKAGIEDDPPILREARTLLEKDNNFAVAEEYINRFDNGENNITDELQVVLHDPDTFSEFLSDEVFDGIYKECTRNNGKALKTYGWDYISRNFPKGWTTRLREDSRNILTNWPSRKNTSSSVQIKKLFEALGFSVTDAKKTSGKKEEIYKLTIEPTTRSLTDYRHPIAAFGTQAKSPLNIILLYGNNPAQQLVDTVTNLNLGGIAVVLLDSPIDRAVRRQICEIFHTRTQGQNRFIVIDHVLAIFLALHQSTERLPVLLKCTLPYTTYQPFVRDGGSTADEMFCGRATELSTIIDPNGACVVYGGRQLGKTALLERAESRCLRPENKAYAVYCNIIECGSEKLLVEKIRDDVKKKTDLDIPRVATIKELCSNFDSLFRNGKIVSMLLLMDEADKFLDSISYEGYTAIQPFIDLKRETKNNFKFVLAGLHNVCRAEKATARNGVFGQLGTPLCVKPLSPTDALQLLSRPLRYLGFQIDRYPHLETILTNTNYYPGILQFFGYMLVETLTGHYGKYYRAVDGNPPFTLQDDQLGAVMNSADLNKSIREKFRWSLDLDPRYFMIARCIALLYYYRDEDSSDWLGYSVEEIMNVAAEYDIICLQKEGTNQYLNLLDEMVDMGILSRPTDGRYRLRRSSFINIIGTDLDAVDKDIIMNNKESV